jgi:hypothetical protein
MTKTLSICVVLLLAGCARTPDSAPPIDSETKRYNIGSYWVREFRLDDGTRCVAMVDTGIQCDWQSQKVEQ